MDALTDFLSQMHFAALEETPLYEVPRGSTDLLHRPVVHGPWPAASCAAVLNIWYGLGWLDLYYPDRPAEWNIEPAEWASRLDEGGVLSRADSEALLSQPERWIFGHADGWVSLFATDIGHATSWQDWHEAAFETAQRLAITG